MGNGKDFIELIDVNCGYGARLRHMGKSVSAADLTEVMDFVGISQAFTYNTGTVNKSIKQGNELVIQETLSIENLYPVLVVVPTAAQEYLNISQLKEICELQGVRMIRLFPMKHNYTLSTWLLGDILTWMQDCRVPLVLDYQESVFSNIKELVSAFPKLPLILTNTGYWRNRDLYGLLEKTESVYVEISSLLFFNGVEHLVNNFTAERVLFGTGMPFQEPGKAVFRLLYSDLSYKQKESIGSGNVQKLMKKVNFF